MKFSLFTLFFLSTSILSVHAKEDIQGEVINKYLSVQEALVSGDFPAFKASAQKLKSTFEKADSKLYSEARELAEVSNLKEARQEFKDVSSAFIKKYQKDLKDGLILVYCPMAGAKWVQKKGKIANPYMEKEMSECGEKI